MQYDPPIRRLLYVEDQPLLRKRIGHSLRKQYAHLRVAATVAEARLAAVPGTLWCGIISDQHLPDGEGLDLICEFRAIHGQLPAVLTTGDLSRGLANACTRARVQYVVKPFGDEELVPLFEQLPRAPGDRELSALGELATRTRASPRECQVMYLALVEKKTAVAIAAELGLSPNTVKTHVRRILTKCSVRSMHELRREIAGTNVLA